MLIIALLLWGVPASAREILVVVSQRATMYEQALKGFRASCPADIRVVVLADYADPDLGRVIREERPRLTVTIGDGALQAVRRAHQKPGIALMTLGLRNQDATQSGISGVGLFAPPEEYLASFRRLGVKRIGVIYDPSRTGWYVKQARAQARQYGVELVLREAVNPRQTINLLTQFRGNVDGLWLLPDASTLTMESLEAFFLFSQAHSVPVVSFTSNHLRLGALLVVEADPVEMGKQGGEMAQQILKGGRSDLATRTPRKVSVRVNEAVARRLGFHSELSATLVK
ncbi:ABC transporter substrate-binding protein [Geomonas sp. Red32]|uniref:ABC transporter substrate-binding protein n=1 Tax=Geomonas sp. Red32 TaxID=2912856 RepID=UPI00202D0D55|nr:ABC transporter substrate binding protein [Geomonas sp. Red32]MCM0080819.1 ABC transporter substrate-binding protein [Geomonas sp. Red32]